VSPGWVELHQSNNTTIRSICQLPEITFSNWFQKITGYPEPRKWQLDLASRTDSETRLIGIPTGLGKTEGVIATWGYHRVMRADSTWPRRLIWCLPMRVLVEQTYDLAKVLADRINEHVSRSMRVDVHQAMGGEEIGDWFLYPERNSVIIGTQDMLLSRALNRGYGSSRARWPIEFGLLNADSLWVMDEVQLMDVGLATSAQIQAYREQDQQKGAKRCKTWWMSATLQPEWLRSVDTEKHYIDWCRQPCIVHAKDRKGNLFDVNKKLHLHAISEKDSKQFAELVLHSHKKLEDEGFGRVTLVVCNTVKRACETYDAIRQKDASQDLRLVHGRFRPTEREQWRGEFLSRPNCCTGTNRIIVATQVVEAGVDISSGCLVTDLAPWTSLVQRFGRCARYGGNGVVHVVDRGISEKSCSPYSEAELLAALDGIQKISDVGITELQKFEESLDPADRRKLFPYDPQHLLVRQEFDELFDTTPDLTGADIDISRFIRSGDERDVHVFWIDIEKGQKPDDSRQPDRRELCAVPFLEARNWLCGDLKKSSTKSSLDGKKRDSAWVWDWIDGTWKTAKRSDLIPGRIVCVASRCGGYHSLRGFDSASNEPVKDIRPAKVVGHVYDSNLADNEQQNDQMSFQGWKTIGFHSLEVKETASEIATLLELEESLCSAMIHASLWHDIGKAHPAFQSIMKPIGANKVDPNVLLAKSGVQDAGRVRYFADDIGQDLRVGFRHELASALALFAVLGHYKPDHPALLGKWGEWLISKETQPLSNSVDGSNKTGSTNESDAIPKFVSDLLSCSEADFDLLIYLVASHHGKVRLALHASPSDQDYVDRIGDGRGLPIRGIRDGDVLQSVRMCIDDHPTPPLTLSLEPAAMGLSNVTGRSWRERSQSVIDRIGPIQLGYLEAVFRAADVRASKLQTIDTAIKNKVDK
jgi:CRISPR-associated endonuclease/helicase Cas3